MINPIMTLQMRSGRTIQIELYPKLAPNTVNSVIALARKGSYNGSKFYRVVKDFVIQTGCSNKDGYGMYSENMLNGEFKANGFSVEQPQFTKGIVGMCGLEPNTSDESSFFIMTRNDDRPQLNDNYAVIGKVINGMDEVMRINDTATIDKKYKHIAFNQPVVDEIIESLTVKTFGVAYAQPVTLPYPSHIHELIKELGEL